MNFFTIMELFTVFKDFCGGDFVDFANQQEVNNKIAGHDNSINAKI